MNELRWFEIKLEVGWKKKRNLLWSCSLPLWSSSLLLLWSCSLLLWSSSLPLLSSPLSWWCLDFSYHHIKIKLTMDLSSNQNENENGFIMSNIPSNLSHHFLIRSPSPPIQPTNTSNQSNRQKMTCYKMKSQLNWLMKIINQIKL